jgi:hypothetical protein
MGAQAVSRLEGFGSPISPFLAGQVRLRVRANVGGTSVFVEQVVAEEAYRDPSLKKAIQDRMRHELVSKILEKWQPVIEEHR